jgi:hypothetical protein
MKTQRPRDLLMISLCPSNQLSFIVRKNRGSTVINHFLRGYCYFEELSHPFRFIVLVSCLRHNRNRFSSVVG